MSQSNSEHQKATYAGPTCPGIAYQDLLPEQQEMSDILYKMECHDLDLLGSVHLGRDGIFRYLDADCNIHYAIALRPALIKALLDRSHYDKEEESFFRGVDGTKTPKEQWYNPLPGILPESLSKELQEEGREFLQKNQRKIDQNREASRDYKERLVFIESDHKLE